MGDRALACSTQASAAIASCTISSGPARRRRLDRDVLVQTGVNYLIVLQGNTRHPHSGSRRPPGRNVTAEQIIQGHRQMIVRAHAMGLRVFGGTLNPVEGYPFPGFWTAAMEEKRRTSIGGFAQPTPMMPSSTSTRSCAIRAIRRACCPSTTAAITSIQTMSAIAPWPMPSTCHCSATTAATDPGDNADAPARTAAKSSVLKTAIDELVPSGFAGVDILGVVRGSTRSSA